MIPWSTKNGQICNVISLILLILMTQTDWTRGKNTPTNSSRSAAILETRNAGNANSENLIKCEGARKYLYGQQKVVNQSLVGLLL